MVDHIAGKEEWQGPSRKVIKEREELAKGGQGKKGKGGLKNPDPYKTKNPGDKRNENSDEFSSDSN
jgi:hypothetical protein